MTTGKTIALTRWPDGQYSPWNSPGQNTGVGNLSLLRRIFPTQGSNTGLPHCRQILYQLNHQGSPRRPEWVAYPFSSGSSRPRNWTGISSTAGWFFTNWAMGESLEEFTTGTESQIWASINRPVELHETYWNIHPQHPRRKGKRERSRKNIWRNNGQKLPKFDEIYSSVHSRSTNLKQNKLRDSHLNTSQSNCWKTKKDSWMQQERAHHSVRLRDPQ